MAVEVHQPPSYYEAYDLEPAVFLAGPIQGAEDWQDHAIETLDSLWTPDSALHIFNPRWDIDPATFVKSDQLSWEKRYLRDSAILGGLVFFLPVSLKKPPCLTNQGEPTPKPLAKNSEGLLGGKIMMMT